MGPSLTLDEKKGSPGTTLDCTNAYSSTFGSPLSPRRHISANSAPAYAIDSVADPCTFRVSCSCHRMLFSERNHLLAQ